MIKNNQRKKRRIVFVGAVFALSVTALLFIVVSFRDNMVFFYSPTDLKAVNLKTSKVIRVGGMIKEKTIQYLPDSVIQFTVTDFKNDLNIRYRGLKPNLFREQQGMVAKGFFDKQQDIFIATELLTKHDENYMPPEVAKSISKHHLNGRK